jgi:hypothetical protein
MQKLLLFVFASSLFFKTTIATADDTFVYAVQISAVVQTSPPSITLNWEQDPYGAVSYTIYRKSKTATAWGTAIATLGGAITNYTDKNVTIGVPYEYQIVKVATQKYTGYGYIFSGIQVPQTETRGTLILVVATNSAFGMDNELAQYQSDLVGDGWSVIRMNVSSNDTPQHVRAGIMAWYNSDPADINAVFLFGHVPILESGYLNYDGHYTRAMPADTYYGEMNNDWNPPADPTKGPSYIPSDVALMVGRVDMANMVGQGAATPWPSEQALLQNYLIKDHKWRFHQINVPRLALMGDRRGSEDGPLAMAASGYRVFEPCVGPGNTIEADVSDTPVPSNGWMAMLASGDYLWCFGDGAGEVNGISYLGTNQPYNFVYSTDIVGQDAHAVFVMLFGSYFGNWDATDDIMRAVLATPTMGLTCCMSGEPHWFLHHMGLGETIGYGTRLTMNNSTLYKNETNQFTRAVYINLMGDPTLRMEPLAPPWSVSSSSTPGGVNLTWAPSPDSVIGYHVYRGSSTQGPFARITSNPVNGTSFLDTNVTAGTSYAYMIRSVELQVNPSGSYYNLSQGMFTSINYSQQPPPPPINVSIISTPGGPVISWNTGVGNSYHVEATASVVNPAWVNLSGSLVTTGTNLTWTDENAYLPAGFYRVVSP